VSFDLAPPLAELIGSIREEVMQRYEFQLNIPSETYLAYYRGTAQQVVVRCFDGVTIQFPAALLKQFIKSTGIHGNFALTCQDNHKAVNLIRLPTRY
jgi:hypothetical protein